MTPEIPELHRQVTVASWSSKRLHNADACHYAQVLKQSLSNAANECEANTFYLISCLCEWYVGRAKHPVYCLDSVSLQYLFLAEAVVLSHIRVFGPNSVATAPGLLLTLSCHGDNAGPKLRLVHIVTTCNKLRSNARACIGYISVYANLTQ